MKYKLAIAFAVVAVAAFLFGWSFGPRLAAPPTATVTVPENFDYAKEREMLPDQPAKAQTVSVMLDFGDGTVKSFDAVPFTDGQSLFDVMKQLSERGDGFVFKYQPPGQYGILIDQIGDKAGGADGKYWLWWENDRMGQVASDAYKLKQGDIVEWKFINLKS